METSQIFHKIRDKPDYTHTKKYFCTLTVLYYHFLLQNKTSSFDGVSVMSCFEIFREGNRANPFTEINVEL